MTKNQHTLFYQYLCYILIYIVIFKRFLSYNVVFKFHCKKFHLFLLIYLSQITMEGPGPSVQDRERELSANFFYNSLQRYPRPTDIREFYLIKRNVKFY